MPGRYSNASPNRHHAVERQHEDETWQDWLNRQNRPTKNVPRKVARATTFEAAIAEMVEKKKADAAGATARRPQNPEGN